jgi:ribonucleotide monophosphatase NagD (HAD superfamily)
MRRVRQVLPREKLRVLVVDDNVDSGIRGGVEMGFDTLLVLSGWHRTQAEAEQAMRRLDIRPTYVLPSIVG